MPSNCLIANFGTEMKIIYVFSGWNFKILLLHLKSVPSNFFNCKIWCKKNKTKCKNKTNKKNPLNLGQKMPDLVIFGLEFNQHRQIFLNAKSDEKVNSGEKI